MASPEDIPSYAIIDGKLCRLNRRGTVVKRHSALGLGFSEFVVAGARVLVREQEDGFLSGMPNLYCLDANLCMLWLAELPSPTDAYSEAPSVDESGIICRSREGRLCRLNLETGKVESQEAALARA